MENINLDRDIVGFSELRNNLSDFINRAVNNCEEIISGNIKTNKNGTISMIPTKMLDEILSSYKFNPQVSFDEETKQFEIILDEIGVYGFGDTLEDAIEVTTDLVIDSKDDFFEQIDKYVRFDKYKKMYPYFLRIKHCGSLEELVELLGLKGVQLGIN